MGNQMDNLNLLRNQQTVSVGTSSVQLAGPNPRRYALLISAPVPAADAQVGASVYQHAVDTSATGIKASYTVPAGTQSNLVSATFQETTGTTVVGALELLRGGTTTVLQSYTKNGTWTGNLPLLAGDVIQWDVTTAVALSVSDFSLGILQDQASARVTLSYIGDAVLDQGINLYPGNSPLLLAWAHIGSAVRESIQAIAASAGQTVTVVDIFA